MYRWDAQWGQMFAISIQCVLFFVKCTKHHSNNFTDNNAQTKLNIYYFYFSDRYWMLCSNSPFFPRKSTFAEKSLFLFFINSNRLMKKNCPFALWCTKLFFLSENSNKHNKQQNETKLSTNTNRCALCMLTFVLFFMWDVILSKFSWPTIHIGSQSLNYWNTLKYLHLFVALNGWAVIQVDKAKKMFFFEKIWKSDCFNPIWKRIFPIQVMFMGLHMLDFITRNKLRLFRDLIKDLMTFFSNPKMNANVMKKWKSVVFWSDSCVFFCEKKWRVMVWQSEYVKSIDVGLRLKKNILKKTDKQTKIKPNSEWH